MLSSVACPRCWLLNDQARIHTGFHRFTEIGQNFQNKKNRYVYIFNKSKLQVESRQDPKTVPTTASATLKEINHTMYPNITECLRIFQPYQSPHASVKGMCRL